MSQDRARDGYSSPGATGVRYFQLYETMGATADGALAYPCKWNNTTSGWEANLTATKVRIYPGPLARVGYADDFVACIFMARSKRWEMINRVEDWGWARLSAELTALGNVTARVWFDVAGTMTDSGFNITVYDRLLGDALPALTRVRWVYDPRKAKRYVTEHACDPDTSSTIWGT